MNSNVVILYTAWKVSKYEVISVPNTGEYGPQITSYLDTSHPVIIASFTVMGRKIPRKLKLSTKKYLHYLLKNNLSFSLKETLGRRKLLPPSRSCQKMTNMHDIFCVEGKADDKKTFFNTFKNF